jgi:hypothetical protein
MTPRRYLVVLATSFAAALALLAAAVCVIDPYEIYGSAQFAGVNAVKYQVNAYERVIKPVAVARLRPRALIFGSSRAAAGLDPRTLERHAGGPAYNSALNGGSMDDLEMIFRWALEKSEMRTAVVGLDYFSFAELRHGGDENPLTLISGQRSDRLRAYVELTLSLRALVHVVDTVAGNAARRTATHDKLGMYVNYDPANVPFAAKDTFRHVPMESRYAALERLLRLAHERNIDLRLYLSPTFHSDRIDNQNYRGWVARVSAIAQREGVRLHNFADDPHFTNDRAAYYDQGHIRPATGDLMLRRMFDEQARP